MVALDHKDPRSRALLAYLRTARKAKLATMSSKLGYDANLVRRSIEGLVESGIVLSEDDSFVMSAPVEIGASGDRDGRGEGGPRTASSERPRSSHPLSRTKRRGPTSRR
ncbi:hypothetical protein AOQ71_04645 [Bradyrhizobium manausense]|uniref:Uncharacterized protein n=1 Tax=Bradyrhizobium manausense TaxID=989370 RepID=A0A0R3E3F4_9BRAD|nr:hypothetical protein AOQ71_04645 [Bradyrhizobium manausense]